MGSCSAHALWNFYVSYFVTVRNNLCNYYVTQKYLKTFYLYIPTSIYDGQKLTSISTTKLKTSNWFSYKNRAIGSRAMETIQYLLMRQTSLVINIRRITENCNIVATDV
jgi:hypothetical protein